MKNRYLTILQMVASSLLDTHENWLDRPVGIVKESNTNNEGIKRLKNMLCVVLESPSISYYTKRFITSCHLTVKQMINEIDAENRSKLISVGVDKDVVGSSYSKINKDLAKDTDLISGFISYDDFFNCISNNVESYVAIDSGIAEFIAKHGASCNERGNLLLDISTSVREKNYYCGNPEFFNRLTLLKPYLVSVKDKVESEINSDREFIGYLNYLLSLAPIVDDGRASKDRDMLIRFLRGQDITKDINKLN